MNEYQPKQSYLRVATGCPEVAVADTQTNCQRIKDIYEEATYQDVSLITFPELSITGYTIGDLVNQNRLLNNAKEGLVELAEATKYKETAMIVGLPLQVDNNLFNCAAVLSDGKIQGIVPKKNMPNHNEFYEDRWFETWNGQNTEIEINGQKVPFGNDLLFDIDGVITGVEICEDLWVANPPSNQLAQQGAVIIANPSASPEQIGKDQYRLNLVANQSGRLIAGYVYAGCDTSESTMDIVMGGHQIIAEDGQIKAEKKAFTKQTLTMADIDVDHLKHDRRKQGFASYAGALVVKTNVIRKQKDLIDNINRHPFLPFEANETQAEMDRRLEQIFQIQAQGLANRMKNTNLQKLVLGLSGGLDSTLALFVACQAAKILDKDPAKMIQTITMPGPASSNKTQNNAQELAQKLGVPNKTVPIAEAVTAQLKAIDHDMQEQDVTYENVQARTRTQILFNYANKEQCLVLGTGDLSEIALGWCTFNGDQMSHYNVNASVPKTVAKVLTTYLGKKHFAKAKEVTEKITGTNYSPELVNKKGELSQVTEDILGPYELHDFFLSYLVRWGDEPAKIAYLAKKAFEDTYEPEEIDRVLEIHLKRFAQNQWKRSVMPDGPKVGSVALSPRGDWRMPSDLPNQALWQ